jgi:hydrogenase maturation protein HypF
LSTPRTAPEGGEFIELRGVVQGVGFRPWVYQLAHEEGVRGSVRNDPSGVQVEAWAPPEVLDRFCTRLVAGRPPGAEIDQVVRRPLGGHAAPAEFTICESGATGERTLSIPADRAVCVECLRELFDPADRRFRYPFINCTHCGPRFTIAFDVPYDRVATTMNTFPLCSACSAEYEDPLDRRFHAQPNACPRCGPQLALWDAQGCEVTAADPIVEVANRLRNGEIVALKGLGGFHLACRADQEAPVVRLRQRKHRDAKPFAVMVQDLEFARRLCEVSALEAQALEGPEAPIVLLPRRPSAPLSLAAAVAPGLDLIGLMLPYTPLHHLLLREVGLPLVMTSANLSDEPIVYRDRDCLAKLGGIADAFLVHDRPIAAPADDSVVRLVAGAPVLLRRSRGYVPRAIPLARAVDRPILGVGGQLKNTVCLAVGDTAFFSQHLGDLDTVEAYDAFEEAIDRLERYLEVAPEVIAHDLHPDYLSTRYALQRRRRDEGPELVGVQHHHAHLAAALADHARVGPALGVLLDGTGYGTDGTAWGGEILWGDAAGFERIAHLRPLPLAGGERAIHEVWRLALALLDDAAQASAGADLEGLSLFAEVGESAIRQVRGLLAKQLRCPLATGAGRLFDAVGALLLAQPQAHHEGQVALRLERLAAPCDPASSGSSRYDFEIHCAQRPWQIDLRPAVRSLVAELRSGEVAGRIAWRFHRTLAAALAACVGRAQRELAFAIDTPVLAGGGCFANDLLSRQLSQELGETPLLMPSRVPPGDGGLALGQVVVASSRLREGAEISTGGGKCA